jgi:radical SAM superfamily enzyme YgiQ (UPF0313 family)
MRSLEAQEPSADQPFPPLGNQLNVLMVWPPFPPSFWGFESTLPILGRSTMVPPLGLITVAALCPQDWTIRLVDEALDELTDDDILWADLVMVSGMHVQQAGIEKALGRCRRLGRRTIVGGPYVSSRPDLLRDLADHVVVGEPDECFAEIARDLEEGTARRLYEITDKPDVTATPIPRFDLLDFRRYRTMPIQFARGCPFQCEFCDIITIYGRKPRTKHPDQILRELEALRRLGWHDEVFLVDDNFIGNHLRAMELLKEVAAWQERNGYPFLLFTEVSIDLAQRPELIDAMVDANFFYVYVGIESPSEEALKEAVKRQNLRRDQLESLQIIYSRGLWITGGFIVGFDSDREDIFAKQFEFITAAAIPWALVGTLQALPTTPLYGRLLQEGRLYEDIQPVHIRPNFEPKMPLISLLRGYRDLVAGLYHPKAYFDRSLRSLERWQPRCRISREYSFWEQAAIVVRSIWRQGFCSSYRAAYWKFLVQLVFRCVAAPNKFLSGAFILFSAHHFITRAADVVAEVDEQIRRLKEEPAGEPRCESADLLAASSLG